MVKGKKTLKKSKSITKSKFDKMTDAQKRVAIAKDVLKQIEAKKYVSTPGTYVAFGGDGFMQNVVQKFLPEDFSWDTTPDPENCYNGVLQAAREANGREFVKKQKKCYVCGIGAAVCSAARLFDDCSALDLQVNFRGVVGRFFDEEQQNAIEDTFECSGGDGDHKIQKLKSPTARLKAIFKNIVKNKGTFVVNES